jgi:hypothetical protein
VNYQTLDPVDVQAKEKALAEQLLSILLQLNSSCGDNKIHSSIYLLFNFIFELRQNIKPDGKLYC